MSKVLVVCARRYNCHELWTALGVMQERGHEFEVVSTDKTIKDELTLRPNTIKRTVYEVDDIELFDAIMIVSGNMKDTEAYWDDKTVLKLISDINQDDGVVAAICCSVPTIRQVANGKQVSFYPLVRSRERLRDAGAILKTVALTVDGRLVTAEHQMATQMWAEEFCNVLEGLPPEYNLQDSGYVPKGRPRRITPELQKIMDINRIKKETQNDSSGST
jgi:putative intracellular protease/amidase